MRRQLLLPTVALLVALGVVMAVRASEGRGLEVDIGIRYSRFEPVSLTVPARVPVTFVLRNEDPIDHEWIVGDEALHDRHRRGTEPYHVGRPTERSLPALGEVRTTITFDRPGTYRFICHLPGHEAYGMVGTVTVGG